MSLFHVQFTFGSSIVKVKKSEKSVKTMADLHTRLKSRTFAVHFQGGGA